MTAIHGHSGNFLGKIENVNTLIFEKKEYSNQQYRPL